MGLSVLFAWVVFPLALLSVVAGCGLLVEALSRRRLATPLLPAAGLAAIVAIGQFLILADPTAELTTPVVIVIGLIGLALGIRYRLGAPPGWALAAALAVFAVYAAPIVLSGEATFAGYIKLDDTSTWLALTDRIMEHGRSLEGLEPSTYEATLDFNLGDGYPIGVFVPLGVGAALSGQDVAWVVQPYMAVWAAVLALALWELAGGLVADGRMRAGIAFLAAQPALLFGYYLWGGIKEVAAIALIATAAALLPGALEEGRLRLLPAAIVCAALVGVLSVAGAVWLAPLVAVAVALAVRALGWTRALGRGAALALLTGLLSLPVLIAGGLLPPTSSPLTDPDALGNLGDPLDPLQAAGIWPAGDFRLAPAELLVTHIAIAVVAAGAIGGLAVAWRRRAWGVAAFVAGLLGVGAALALAGSPWVEGKAFAIASVAIPFAALLAAAALWSSGRRALAGALAAIVAGGVLWSNALAYRDVNLAPREQLAELERIGEEIAGEGPTLITEYQPYGARHFLRDADPEAVSELRRRLIPLRDGTTVRKGLSADTDALDPDDLLVYRTLVVRRSPAQSRPPSPYRPTWRGHYYEVWQRPPQPPGTIARLGLGGAVQPSAVPRCERVLALARGAGPGGALLAAKRRAAIVVRLAPGELSAPAEVRRAGAYEAWLQGSVRPAVTLEVDGRAVGEVRHFLNNAGQYVRFGEVELEAGRHRLELRFGGADLHPGSGGAAEPVGPLVLSPVEGAGEELVEVRAADAGELCGRRWDWIEAAG